MFYLKKYSYCQNSEIPGILEPTSTYHSLLCDFIASVDFNFNAPPKPSCSYFSLLLPDLDP